MVGVVMILVLTERHYHKLYSSAQGRRTSQLLSVCSVCIVSGFFMMLTERFPAHDEPETCEASLVPP